MYTLHMYMRTRYADLSGKEMKSWRKFVKALLEGFCYLTFSWYFVVGGFSEGRGRQISSHTFNYSIIQFKKINSLCEKYKKKKRIYLIIVLIYYLDGGNKWDINTYEYITNDKWCFFYIGRSIFR